MKNQGYEFFSRNFAFRRRGSARHACGRHRGHRRDVAAGAGAAPSIALLAVEAKRTVSAAALRSFLNHDVAAIAEPSHDAALALRAGSSSGRRRSRRSRAAPRGRGSGAGCGPKREATGGATRRAADYLSWTGSRPSSRSAALWRRRRHCSGTSWIPPERGRRRSRPLSGRVFRAVVVEKASRRSTRGTC